MVKFNPDLKTSMRPTKKANPKSVPKLTSTQKVELHIKEAIYHGALKPRERIIEVELATQLGCSRAPVRQAIQRLVREGLIVTVPRRGVFIRDFTPDSIEEIFCMRAKLEGLCVRSMRQRRALPELAAALNQCLDALDGASITGDREQFLEADMNLHRTIWKLSGGKEYYRTLNSLMILFILLIARTTSERTSLAESAEDHRRYVETILESSIENVEARVEDYFLGIFASLFGKPEPIPVWRAGKATWLLDA